MRPKVTHSQERQETSVLHKLQQLCNSLIKHNLWKCSFLSLLILAVCEPDCGEYGICYEPNKCLCQEGWHGRHCNKSEQSQLGSFLFPIYFLTPGANEQPRNYLGKVAFLFYLRQLFLLLLVFSMNPSPPPPPLSPPTSLLFPFLFLLPFISITLSYFE